MKKLSLIISLILCVCMVCYAQQQAQCQATTKKGTQCSRKAQEGSNYCWQHNPNRASAKTNNAVSGGKSADSKQCQATTKKGTQCKRKAMPESNFCWQHDTTKVKGEHLFDFPIDESKDNPNVQQHESTQQCQATTKKGTQCKRKAVTGSKYCKQHQK